VAHFDAFIDSAASPEPARRTRLMTIIAQDPAVRFGGQITRARVSVPVDRLEPGPRSSRFHVVDYDASAGRLNDPSTSPTPGSTWRCAPGATATASATRSTRPSRIPR